MATPSGSSVAEMPRTGKTPKPRFSFDSSNPQAVIDSNQNFANAFQVEKHKKEAARNWDLFYKNHPNPLGEGIAFFKDRHWTSREFEVLGRLPGIGKGKAKAEEGQEQEMTVEALVDPVVLEVGCGTGAFVYPLLQESPSTRFHAFDFSKRAVEQVQQHPNHDPSHVHAFVHDLTRPDGSPSLFEALSTADPSFWMAPSKPEAEPLPSTSQLPDVVSCIFVLSALPPSKQANAVKELFSVLKPGGTLILRDYALHDQAQLRFHALPSKSYAAVPSLLSPPASSSDDPESGKAWYRRGDSTLCYFFTAEEMDALVKGSVEEGWRMEGGVTLVERGMENRAEKWGCTRRFIQGSWRKVAV